MIPKPLSVAVDVIDGEEEGGRHVISGHMWCNADATECESCRLVSRNIPQIEYINFHKLIINSNNK